MVETYKPKRRRARKGLAVTGVGAVISLVGIVDTGLQSTDLTVEKRNIALYANLHHPIPPDNRIAQAIQELQKSNITPEDVSENGLTTTSGEVLTPDQKSAATTIDIYKKLEENKARFISRQLQKPSYRQAIRRLQIAKKIVTFGVVTTGAGLLSLGASGVLERRKRRLAQKNGSSSLKIINRK